MMVLKDLKPKFQGTMATENSLFIIRNVPNLDEIMLQIWHFLFICYPVRENNYKLLSKL